MTSRYAGRDLSKCFCLKNLIDSLATVMAQKRIKMTVSRTKHVAFLSFSCIKYLMQIVSGKFLFEAFQFFM